MPNDIQTIVWLLPIEELKPGLGNRKQQRPGKARPGNAKLSIQCGYLDYSVGQSVAFLQPMGGTGNPSLQKRGWQNCEAGCGLGAGYVSRRN